jgi:hypothetical protein
MSEKKRVEQRLKEDERTCWVATSGLETRNRQRANMLGCVIALLAILCSSVVICYGEPNNNDFKMDHNKRNLKIEKAYSTGSQIAGYNTIIKAPTDVTKRLFVVHLQVPVKAGDRIEPKVQDLVAECGSEKTAAIALGASLEGGPMAWTNYSLTITATKPGTFSFAVVFELASKTSDFRLHWGDSALDVKIDSNVSK